MIPGNSATKTGIFHIESEITQLDPRSLLRKRKRTGKLAARSLRPHVQVRTVPADVTHPRWHIQRLCHHVGTPRHQIHPGILLACLLQHCLQVIRLGRCGHTYRRPEAQQSSYHTAYYLPHTKEHTYHLFSPHLCYSSHHDNPLPPSRVAITLSVTNILSNYHM